MIMNIKELIKTLLGIDINTDNLLELYESPQDYVSNPKDLKRLEDLFFLVDLVGELEVNADEQ